HIIREVLVPISFMLVGRPNGPTELAQLRSVATHTHAWAQVRGWAEANIAQANFVQDSSTAAGARSMLDDTSDSYAGVCDAHPRDTRAGRSYRSHPGRGHPLCRRRPPRQPARTYRLR